MRHDIFPQANTVPAGYAALIMRYDLRVPLPHRLCAVSTARSTFQESAVWHIFPKRYAPQDTLYGHVTFALKYEGIDLLILDALFQHILPQEIEAIVHHEPHGKYARRLWFLYEYLKETALNLPNVDAGNFVDLVDEKLQYPGPPRPSKRHRVRNNLSGVRNFCPLVRRTSTLDHVMSQDIQKDIVHTMRAIHPDVIMRAAAFLLLEDSKASYAIEGESPSYNRAERWGRIIGQAGQRPLSHALFEQLQREVITDTRFIHMGYRTQGGFIGTHDRTTSAPIPSHISARHQDIHTLMTGLMETFELLKDGGHSAILTAAVCAFGFVFIHPFEDGNGRIHRYLMHHILAEMNFTPKGVVFPVSAVILKRLSDYRITLEQYAHARLPFITWRPTHDGNVDVLNDTKNLYRFFDATHCAEFFYACVQETITDTLPREVRYLQQHDAMKTFIAQHIDMPDRTADLMIQFLHQNQGKFSKRAQNKEFVSLSAQEISTLERAFHRIFYENE